MPISELLELISTLCSISIRLASLDVPNFNMALKVSKAQSALFSAQSNLNSILIELSNVPSPSVPYSKM